MKRSHQLLAAALIFAPAAAMAQAQMPTPGQPSTPSTTMPSPATPGTTMPGTPSVGATTTTPPTSAGQLSANQYLGSKLDGADVYNAANEKIADVADVILNDQGQVVGVIVSYGGLAGIGQSHVAIDPRQLRVVRVSDDEMRVESRMTMDDLRNAPQFSYSARAR